MTTFGLPRLCVICDADACARAGWQLRDYAETCLDAGARFLQIRAKSASSGALLRIAEDIVSIARPSGALLLVNDRADIAALAGAGGVHVGQEDLQPADARTIVGPASCIGLSTHTIEQLLAAAEEPIDYAAIGPVYGTATKETGYPPLGLAPVERARVLLPGRLPLVAIGGITLENAAEVIRAGADSVAVIADLLVANDPAARIRAYLNRLE